MSSSHRDRPDQDRFEQESELTPEELGKVSGGSIPVKLPPQGGGDGEAGSQLSTNPGRRSPTKPRSDDFIKPF